MVYDCSDGRFLWKPRWLPFLIGTMVFGLYSGELRADVFRYVDAEGTRSEVEGRLLGGGQGALAVQEPDGGIRLIPEGAVQQRIPAAGPEPASHEAVAEALTKRFGEDRFRVLIEKPYVIGIVLTSPLPGASEIRVRGFLRKAARFMQNVEGVFEKFARSVRVELTPPEYPLVLLIFETDADFEEYATESTGGRGVSAQNILGFYSGLTNWLAIRLGECNTFEVPLHEAIHQQVYNRGVFQRLAPVPSWFNEGIATGFEGNGDRIDIGPLKINSSFARRARQAGRIDWAEIVGSDRAFRGDLLAGDAYTHAWSLHWLLVTGYREAYTEYVRQLAQKPTLSESDPEARTREFVAAFGKSPAELQQEFPMTLQTGLRRQRLPRKPELPDGLSRTESGLGLVELTAVSRPGSGVEVQGTLQNTSPIRSMSFHVTVETTGGLYADWHVPNLATNRRARLAPQQVRKVMQNGPGVASGSFRVRINSVPGDSDTASDWSRGRLPVPVFRP